MSDTVYEVARWAEVFETAASRKYVSLPWIAERTDFDSTGWQQGLEEFGPIEWPRVYGNWMILLRTVAKAKVRGRLSGDKGESWTSARIARPSGCDPEGVRIAFEFAVKIGWLVPSQESQNIASGESPDDLPTCRENLFATERNGTERNETERNGTERKETGPVRAGVLNSEQEAEDMKTENRKSKTENPLSDRPASLKLAQRSKELTLLRDLGNMPLSGSGVPLHGSVFSDDRLKPQHILDAPASFFMQWYLDGLTATRPIFRNGNRGQLCFVLAAVYAVRRCTEASLRGAKRIARWIHWIQNHETNQISNADFARAAKEISAHFDGPASASDCSENRKPKTENPATYTPNPDILREQAKKLSEVKKKIAARRSCQQVATAGRQNDKNHMAATSPAAMCDD